MKAPDNLAGKKVRCATCKKITMVPYPSCGVDESRLALLRPFMTTCDQQESAHPGCIAKNTVVYACGAIGREGEPVEHTHAPEEMELCRRLAAEAARVVDGLKLGKGTEGPPPHETALFAPFFITANKGDKIVRNLSEEFLRKKFGGAISPTCPCFVEPLREKGAGGKRCSRTLLVMKRN